MQPINNIVAKNKLKSEAMEEFKNIYVDNEYNK